MAFVLLFTAGAAYRNARQIAEADQRVAHTHQVIRALQDLLGSMVDAETAERGYIITGESTFLEPYNAAVGAVQREVEQLRKLTADNPSQQARATALEPLIAARLKTLQDRVAERKEQGFDAPRQMILSRRGKEEMDTIRRQIVEMERAEDVLLQARADESRQAFSRSVVTLAVATLIGLVMIGLTFSMLRRNMAARERAAAVLREERERFPTTLTSIGNAVIVTDPRGVVTFVNRVARSLTGWQDDAVGASLGDVFNVVNEQTRQPVPNPVSEVIRRGTVVGLANNTVLLTKDGREVPIDDSAAPIHDAAGNLAGVVLIFRDITERRRDEKQVAELHAALRESEERSRSVVDHMIDGIITIDEGGIIGSFNPAAEKLFGYRASEVVDQNVKLLMPEPYQSEHDGYLANYRPTGQAKIIGIGREVEGRRKDDTTFPINLGVNETRLKGSRLFTGIVRDISERKRLEQEIRQKVEQLAVADRRKDEFLATLAHELRNPLAPIRNGVEILRKVGLSEPQFRDVRAMMERQVTQMVRLMDDLLDVSRITRRKLRLEKQKDRVSHGRRPRGRDQSSAHRPPSP